jgi:hypothetical protein
MQVSGRNYVSITQKLKEEDEKKRTYVQDKESRANDTLPLPEPIRFDRTKTKVSAPASPTGQWEPSSSPILTQSDRAVGALSPTPNKEIPKYEVMDAEETFEYRFEQLQQQMGSVQAATMPVKEKQAAMMQLEEQLAMLVDEHHNYVVEQDADGIYESWISPADMVAGPLAYTRLVGKGMGMLTRGLITGPGSLGVKGFTKAMVAATPTEVMVGQTLDQVEEAFMDAEVPALVKHGSMLGIGLIAGGLMQFKLEQGIDVALDAYKKAGINLPRREVAKTVKKAHKITSDEINLVNIARKLDKKKTKADRIGKAKVDKKQRPLNVTKEVKAEAKKQARAKAKEKAAKDPIFEEEVADVSEMAEGSFANLDDVKKINQKARIFPDTFDEAEDLDEFFIAGPSARMLADELKKAGYKGVYDGTEIRKFYSQLEPEQVAEKTVDAVHKDMLSRAKGSAGTNSVTGMAAGTYAGLEWDDEKKRIVGYNPGRALITGLGVASAGMAGYGLVKKFYATPTSASRAMVARAKKGGWDQTGVGEQVMKSLEEAKKMKAAGSDPRKIALATRMVETPDGQWMAYWPDADTANFKVDIEPYQKYKLSEVWDEADLDIFIDPYTDEKFADTISVIWKPAEEGASGAAYFPELKSIIIYEPHKQYHRDLMIHERTHAIARWEGLPSGSAPMTFNKLLYWYATGMRKGGAETLEEQMIFNHIEDIIDRLPSDKRAMVYKAVEDTVKHKVILPKHQAAMWDASEWLYRETFGEQMARTRDISDVVTLAGKPLEKAIDGGEAWRINKQISAEWGSVNKAEFSEAPDVVEATEELSTRIAASSIKKGFFQRWESKSNEVVDTFKNWFSGKIYGTQMRKLLGIDLPKEYRELVTEYDRQTNRILDHTLKLAEELDALAPTQKEQQRLMQVLRGGISSDPEITKAARRVNEIFTELREVARDQELRNYDAYDILTRKQRFQLRNIIRFSDNQDQVLVASKMLQEHYKVGSSYQYLPVLFRTKEGITGQERKMLQKHLKKLKAWTESNVGRVSSDLIEENRAEISEIEELLKMGSGNPYNPKRKQLTRTYKDVLLPEEAKRALYKTDNAIDSASFAAARGLAEQAIDLQRQSFLKAVSENPYWAIAKDTDPELIPSHFRQLKGARYGELNGWYVDKQIAQDIDDLGEVTNEFIRNYDKIMGLWKLGKAVFNPATHVANTVSNIFLAHLGGVSPGDIKTYTQAAQAIRGRAANKWFREAEEWGLMNNTFSAAELSQFRKALSSFREHPEQIGTPEKAKTFFKKWFNTPAALYEKNEQFFKMAVFIKARKLGASVDEAAKKAEDYLFNYRDVPPLVRHYKRYASPFFTFTYKWSGLLAREVIRHPHKLALWGATYAAWVKGAEYMTGADKGEIKRDRENMPGFGALHMPLPWRDQDGNMQYWDISRFTPMGVFDDKWGQTDVPIGAYAPTNNPFIKVLYKVAMNKDDFTGQEIYDTDIDNMNQMLGKIGAMAWKEFTPSLTPGNYGYNQLMKGVDSLQRDVIDYTGQEVTFRDKAMQAILGVKVTSATEEAMNRTLRSEIMRIDIGIGKSINRLRREFHRGEITEEEYNSAVEKYINQRNILKEALYERTK